jgi:type III pantothenate kinase
LRDTEQIWVSNVAGERVARYLCNIGTSRTVKPRFVVSQQQQCGVRNSYFQVAQLGSDRWAALIGAWYLMRNECLVVNSGTATTVDALSAQGEFTGGVILPGVELMQSSLNASTAQLKSDQGKYVPFPKNTADAMLSGAIQASCGAIQRQHALLTHDKASVVLSGGVARVLQDHLTMPLRVVDNLVLQGLLIIAQEESVA